ncbi:MAG: hypothetical protein IJW75_04050 [Alphaproteobacteria bacterium]|nr:hypothetical protein [Alphaproteobacteria bacterium]
MVQDRNAVYENRNKEFREQIDRAEFRASRPYSLGYLVKDDFFKVLGDSTFASPATIGCDEESSKKLLGYAAKLTEKYPDWEVVSAMINSNGYSSGSGGPIQDIYGKTATQHPLAECAKQAPEEFRDLLASSFGNTNCCTDTRLRTVTNNKELFGLSDKDISDMLAKAVQTRNENQTSGKTAFETRVFSTLALEDNKNIMTQFVQDHPKEFDTIIKSAYAEEVLSYIGNGKDKETNPVILDHITQNPDAYNQVVNNARKSGLQGTNSLVHPDVPTSNLADSMKDKNLGR